VNALTRILDAHRNDLEVRKARLPPRLLAELATQATPVRPFAEGLRARALAIIAEVKRASPSRGVFAGLEHDYEPTALARAYAAGGAACLSVLTDIRHFWGEPDALARCRAATALPALRKDFVVEPYDVDEARWLAADCVLLIVAALPTATLHACADRASALGMSVLVEIHADDELPVALDVIRGGPSRLLGVNQRNLADLSVDLGRAARLQIPAGVQVVIESGIQAPADLAPHRARGHHAFLIGEALSASDDVVTRTRAFCQG
jgi:indole-3-glycerol phosphate synthase